MDRFRGCDHHLDSVSDTLATMDDVADGDPKQDMPTAWAGGSLESITGYSKTASRRRPNDRRYDETEPGAAAVRKRGKQGKALPPIHGLSTCQTAAGREFAPLINAIVKMVGT
uniref:Uncharacterized protein n=1 Tax=Trichuris muris TaxID=70415 RepID=A0A5S6QDK2_TRIMR